MIEAPAVAGSSGSSLTNFLLDNDTSGQTLVDNLIIKVENDGGRISHQSKFMNQLATLDAVEQVRVNRLEKIRLEKEVKPNLFRKA